MSTTRILQFTGADLRVTKLGVSSNVEVGTANLVVDTQTGRVGVGVTEPGHTLDVVSEMNLRSVSNTASIKYNSNVVTEYTRSKKLIKYPRVAMTAETTAGYTASASSFFAGYNPWEVFDNNNPVGGNTGSGAGWASTGPGAETDTYDPSTGAEASTTTHHSGSPQGEWIQIQMPDSIYLHDVAIHSRSETNYTDNMTGFPKNVYLYGSNDNSNWTLLKNFQTVSKTLGDSHTEKIDYTSGVFKYFAFVLNSIHVSGTDVGFVSVGQIQLFGIPEYDPEADGTDVVVRSVPNVPNTDWLEVYYDGQDYTSMPSTVTDKSGNSISGTPTGVTFDSTWKAFVFGESDDYITFNPNKSGNYVFSASVWFKSTGSVIETLFTLNGDITANQCAWLYGYGNDLIFDFSENAYTCGIGRSISDGQWHHVCCTYNGNGSLSGRDIYLDGMVLSGYLDGTSAGGTLNLTNSTPAQIGAYNHPTLGYIHEFKGSIANFRLFNRALSADEVWQLYAYQKEYFNVSPDVVTFKGGRLGIGTSEPRAVLDVRGASKFNGPITIPRALFNPGWSKSLFVYVGNASDGEHRYMSTYVNRHEYYQNKIIIPASHVGQYGTGDSQWYDGDYDSTNELNRCHTDNLAYWLKNRPLGHVHELLWVCKNGSEGQLTYGQKISDTEYRIWGFLGTHAGGSSTSPLDYWDAENILFSRNTALKIFYEETIL